MTTDLATQDETRSLAVADREQAAGALAHVLGSGDLFQLSNEERVAHYLELCRSLGLNPLSRPFDWIAFKEGENAPERLALYPNQSCAAQLRRQHHMRIEITRREIVGDLFVCEARATTPDRREDTSAKYVPLIGKYGRLKGQQLANALMRAETGAKRRVTLSMVGLASPPDAEESAVWRSLVIDGTGRIVDNPTDAQKALAADPGMARAIGEPVFEDLEGSTGPLEGMPDQKVRPEEIARPERTSGEKPTFRASDETVKRWLGAWFGAVKGTSLDTDDARHAFVAQWTQDLGWPPAKQTTSLRAMFARMSEAEAADFLGHVRALAEDEKRELLADVDEARGRSGDDVRDAFRLTGATADDDETAQEEI